MTVYRPTDRRYPITSPYGDRDGTVHHGVDFAAPTGTFTYAPADGYVVEGYERGHVDGFGRWVWLDCQASVRRDFIFGHGDPLVRAGQRVRAGQAVMRVNSYGESTGPHLHFEAWTPPGRSGGTDEDPAAWLASARAVLPPAAPDFVEVDMMTGGGRDSRGGQRPVYWLLHTEEGDASARNLASYCSGAHGVSYHYTLRDGVLVDVVDTDYASWSVLDLNPLAINLCFAGTRAGWSRAQWLTRRADIEIAAWTAAQDAMKYGIAPRVYPPARYGELVRAGSGISDHRYVTQGLGVGSHVDVGDGFPWDVFEGAVGRYSSPDSTA